MESDAAPAELKVEIATAIAKKTTAIPIKGYVLCMYMKYTSYFPKRQAFLGGFSVVILEQSNERLTSNCVSWIRNEKIPHTARREGGTRAVPVRSLGGGGVLRA